jgi:flavin reductase (DIM6/NTAB) family NADH-FMN oxidoreductase RutF
MSRDQRALRDALGQFATGVTIITACTPHGERVGLTANSFSSVSLDPPLVLWSLSLYSPSLAAFQHSSHFAVHVLAAQQEALSQRFATSGIDRFKGLDAAEGLGGAPLIDGCVARFECRNEVRHAGGDHMIFVGRVERFDHFGGEPLLFHGGRYGRVNRSVT